MVLQQLADAPFWGSAKPERDVSIKGSWGASAKAIATKDGSWMTKLRTPKAGGPYQVTVQSGDTTVVFRNVLIGEVWLCSGQSNMELPLEGMLPSIPIRNSAEEIRNARNSRMRFFLISRAVAVGPESNCTGEWRESDSATASKFSATAYFFGKMLYGRLKIPIGLIQSSWGGTRVQAWTAGRFLREVGKSRECWERRAEASGGRLQENGVRSTGNRSKFTWS